MLIIDSHINEIQKLCLENKVKSLYVFGSALNETFNSQSDIDLVVDFNNIEIADYADNYYNLKFGLQSIFHRQIDLLEQKAIKNPYFLQQINLQKKMVYGYGSPTYFEN
jgi:predicted nucleotidyltransferase